LHKSLRTLILFLLLVLPGSAVVVVSAYWGINDFIALVAANQRFEALATQGATQRELFIVAHRENTHRINVGFDGTWILLGGILAGIGIVGMVQVNLTLRRLKDDRF
jgi:hypothetical protein